MPVIKKIYGSLFIAIFAIPFSWLILLQVKQVMVRHEMKEKLEQSFLQKITLHKTEVHWVKKNKEIRIGKDLFDVKSFYTENNLVHFTGLYDYEETQTEKELGDFSGKNNGDQQRLGGLFIFLQNLYSDNQANDGKTMMPAAGKYHACNTMLLADFPHKVIPPPPRP